ncbi:MAG: hypothetical protein IJI10_03260 [Eubacterium sp.]|nr:hypothetical protein [Eubacterium sp.]
MSLLGVITDEERQVVRELAKKLAEYANQPEMERRRKLWYAHNDLKTDYPVIMCSPEGSWRELVPPASLKCSNAEMREIEWELRARIFRAEVIHDDVPAELRWDCKKIISDIDFQVDGKSVPPTFANPFRRLPTISDMPFLWAPDFKWSDEAVEFDPLIEEDDLEDPDVAQRITIAPIIFEEEKSNERYALHKELLGDILDVQYVGISYVCSNLMRQYTAIRGYQNTLYDIYDYPDEMHSIVKRIMDLYNDYYDELSRRCLLASNNTCQYIGTGGYGYTNDLPPIPEDPNGFIPNECLWASAESQEFVVVSPETHREFAIDYERPFLEKYGLSAYGCCENLENKLDDVFTIKNMRRISVAPWADVKSMADQIGMKAIFSNKPNPSLVTNGWDEPHQREYITQRLTDAKGTACEYILKDTHTIQNDPYRFRKWTDLCHEIVEGMYGKYE